MRPWCKQLWCIPRADAAFVWRMEDVLALYAEPYDPDRPVICLDEYAVALTAPTRPALPPGRHHPRREDYEYERHGSATLFGCFQPATGWRAISVTHQRTKREFAEVLRAIAEDYCPAATTIRIVLDNLNTHTPAALYEVFPPARARAIAARLELHYTPVHGSWLNMQEVEWAILGQQCLDRHLPAVPFLTREVTAWVADRNAARATVHWRFTTGDARRRLARLYPLGPSHADGSIE